LIADPLVWVITTGDDVELVLEWEEIERLLRQALSANNFQVPENSVMRKRTNNKHGTLRIVFATKREGTKDD
jgi:hypothetical protein